MRAFVIVSGTIFGLIVVAHIMRLFYEPHQVRYPLFVVTTLIAAALSVWALCLVWKSRRA